MHIVAKHPPYKSDWQIPLEVWASDRNETNVQLLEVILVTC